MRRRSIFVAYLLWFFGAFGALGLHRFYINRPVTGFVWLFTFGLFGAGCCIDFLTLWKKVKECNIEIRLRRLESLNSLDKYLFYN